MKKRKQSLVNLTAKVDAKDISVAPNIKYRISEIDYKQKFEDAKTEIEALKSEINYISVKSDEYSNKMVKDLNEFKEIDVIYKENVKKEIARLYSVIGGYKKNLNDSKDTIKTLNADINQLKTTNLSISEARRSLLRKCEANDVAIRQAENNYVLKYNEVELIKSELTSIKSKWWYKLFTF